MIPNTAPSSGNASSSAPCASDQTCRHIRGRDDFVTECNVVLPWIPSAGWWVYCHWCGRKIDRKEDW